MEYPITYKITVYKRDFSGRSTGEVRFVYTKTVNSKMEEQEFYQSFDDGVDDVKPITN
jgi:hypothetical protein|tara:strand:+ start:1549 stop:1722 length:174 start_codon:yes stop_codon:yes gene_type:complete